MAEYLIIYSFLVYGISNAFVYFNGPFGLIDKFRVWISNKHKTFEELFSCMFCLPTNIGIILSILSSFIGSQWYFTPFTILFTVTWLNWPLIAIFDGFFAGGITYLIHTIQQFFEKFNKDGE